VLPWDEECGQTVTILPSVRRGLVALAAGVAAIAVVTVAVAGYTAKGPVVAHGVSPAGVPWKIRGHAEPRSLIFDFVVESPGYADAGYGTRLPRPIPRRFVLTAVPGSDLSPAEESDVSGIADKRVKTLVIRMNDDSKLSFSPTRAPKRVRRRHVWARGLRFFDEFFSPDVNPRAIKALNANGRVLDRLRF
jgi:hypothetical protein